MPNTENNFLGGGWHVTTFGVTVFASGVRQPRLAIFPSNPTRFAMRITCLSLGCLLFATLHSPAAMPLTESVFTEIVQEAKVLTETDKSGKPAKTNEIFKVPDLVRTGQASRVELTAKDQTITRIGANTTFTFADGGRDVILKKGSVLFHSPAGAGGGAIKNRGSSAAVLGTTEIGQVLLDGRFKVMNLEGFVKVTLRNGKSVRLKAGQFVIVSADGTSFGDVTTFNIGEFAAHSLLVSGFSHPVSSSSLIAAASAQQNMQIASGSLTNVNSWSGAGSGLDMSSSPIKGSIFISSNDSSFNPLDFPGHGFGPRPGEKGGLFLLEPSVPTLNSPSIAPPPKGPKPPGVP